MSGLVSPTTNRVIIPDLIGHGLSPAPDELCVYRMEAMVEQLHQLIQEKLTNLEYCAAIQWVLGLPYRIL